MIMAKRNLHVTAHQDLRLPFNNYNQQTPKNNLNLKLNPKNKPHRKNLIGKATTTIIRGR
jgi:hypothetical protein